MPHQDVNGTLVIDYTGWEWCDYCDGLEAVPAEDEGLAAAHYLCCCDADWDDF